MRTATKWLKKLVLLCVALVLVVAVGYAVLNVFTEPSNERVWNDDQAVLPRAEFSGNTVRISNIRNFTYASTTSYTARYYDAVFDLNTITRVWYVVEPFSGFPGSAHTFLSFEFEGERYLSISVEIRKEKGESFSAWRGLFNRYELMYVIADERDVIKLRSNYRKDLVYLYPAKATPEQVRQLFVSMLERANKLAVAPEFYNSITNTCTTNVVRHINAITPKRVPWLNLSVLLPENSDRLAYELGLIDTNLGFNELRARHLINERALRHADSAAFSTKIREME